jgi:hypothetical protein
MDQGCFNFVCYRPSIEISVVSYGPRPLAPANREFHRMHMVLIFRGHMAVALSESCYLRMVY